MKRLLVIALPVLSQTAFANNLERIESAIANGQVDLSFRYRVEHVEQDSFEQSALASTIRSRFSYMSDNVLGFSTGFEVDNVSVIGSDKYNSTRNGNALYPIVADPKSTEINQYWLKYANDEYSITVGRQRINHGNQRFVGGVGWRQNEQTYDGYRGIWDPTEVWRVDYSYIYNVNRIFGPTGPAANAPGNFHLLKSDLQLTKYQSINVFGYWLDFDESQDLSSRTLGFDFSGTKNIVSWHGAYAKQQDYKSNPQSFSLDYWALDIKVDLKPIDLTLGFEELEGDGDRAFSTPLATLHKFQGFADQFLVTPKQGIKDYFVGVGHVRQSSTFKLIYHAYESSANDQLGNEVSLLLNHKLSEKLKVLVKYSRYSADSHSVDTNKAWLQFSYNV